MYLLDIDNIAPNINNPTSSLLQIEMSNIFEPISKIAQSQFQELVHSMTEPFREIRDSMILSISKSIHISSIIPQFHNNPFGDLELTSQRTSSTYSDDTVATNTEIVDVKPLSFHKKSALGLTVLAGGSFRYKRTILKGLSIGKSNHGRLLNIFLMQLTYFATDDEIKTLLHLPDNRGLGYILRDLRKAFKKNGLRIDIERRWRPDGYQLIAVRVVH